MRYLDLFEKTIRIPDQEGMMFVVTKNPSRQQFHNLIFDNESLDCKGLLTDQDFYYWPAWHAHHGQIAYALGLENALRIFVRHNGIMAGDTLQEKVQSHPVLLRLYGGNVPFFPE